MFNTKSQDYISQAFFLKYKNQIASVEFVVHFIFINEILFKILKYLHKSVPFNRNNL